MDCVFTTEEMVNGNPSGMTKSKDPIRKRTIRALDPDKMKFINGILSICMPIVIAAIMAMCMICTCRYPIGEVGNHYHGQNNSKENDAEVHGLLS